MTAAKKPVRMCRIEYTVENRKGATRKAIEVPETRLEKTLAKLDAKDAFNVHVLTEADSHNVFLPEVVS